MRILVVEDESMIRELLSSFLEAEGHQVTLCANGQEGWDTFAKSPEAFELMLADMKMPLLDGLSLLKRVRAGGHRIPCILMTGHAELDEEQQAEVGTVSVLNKPFDPGELLRIVAEVAAKQ